MKISIFLPVQQRVELLYENIGKKGQCKSTKLYQVFNY